MSPLPLGVLDAATSAKPARTAPGEAPMVAVEGLSRTFDISRPLLDRLLDGGRRRHLTAVADVSFAIPPRTTFALVGESGSGKSTIAQMIVGLLPPTAGTIRIDGVVTTGTADPTAQARVRRDVQMIFQDPYASLNPRWKVERIVAEPLWVHRLVTSRQEARERVAGLLALVGLDGRDLPKYPHEFSGGQRQRIAIARAIAAEPRLLVCDEPTSALDVSVQAQILNLMRDLQDRLGLTYLLISHNLAVVRHMADRIGVLYLGRLLEVAAPDQLLAQPRHPYTRLLLDAVPDIDMTGRERRPIEGEPASPIDLPTGCAFHPRCPLAFDRCRREVPLSRTIAGASHLGRQVACHADEEGRQPPRHTF